MLVRMRSRAASSMSAERLSRGRRVRAAASPRRVQRGCRNGPRPGGDAETPRNFLPSEDNVDTGEEKSDLRRRNPTCRRLEQPSVQSNDLRHVGDRVLGETRRSRGEQHVAGCFGPAQIAGQGHADDGSQPAPVQGVALDDNNRPAKPRTGSRGLGQLNPANVTLGDHHSARCRIWLAAAVRKPSSSPTSSQTRFIASVTSSGAWRATYSSRAAAYTSLRDRRARLASRSARAKRSSGIEIAVFIPVV